MNEKIISRHKAVLTFSIEIHALLHSPWNSPDYGIERAIKKACIDATNRDAYPDKGWAKYVVEQNPESSQHLKAFAETVKGCLALLYESPSDETLKHSFRLINASRNAPSLEEVQPEMKEERQGEYKHFSLHSEKSLATYIGSYEAARHEWKLRRPLMVWGVDPHAHPSTPSGVKGWAWRAHRKAWLDLP